MSGTRPVRVGAAVLAVFALVGCGATAGPGSAASPVSTAATDAVATNEPLPLLGDGRFTDEDLDADGVVDKTSYAFPTTDLVPGLALDRTVAVQDAGDHGQTILTFRYTNHGSTRIATTHRIVIPKIVANSVDQLTFSHPPARVIQADPEVEEDVDLDPDKVQEFVVTATEALQEKKAVRVARAVLAAGREACLQMEGDIRDGCLVSLVRDVARILPASELLDVCDEVGHPGYQGACAAIATRNPAECKKMANARLWMDPCIGVYAEFACSDLASKAASDRCYFDLAVDGESLSACGGIADKDTRTLCEAGVTKNADLCAKIGNPELARACAEAIRRGTSVKGLLQQGVAPPDVVPGLPVTLHGTFVDYETSQVTLTLDDSGASGTGTLDPKRPGCPATITFTFTGDRPSRTTWGGQVKVVDTTGASAQDALCQLQGQEPVTTTWRLEFGTDGASASVEGWGELRLK